MVWVPTLQTSPKACFVTRPLESSQHNVAGWSATRIKFSHAQDAPHYEALLRFTPPCYIIANHISARAFLTARACAFLLTVLLFLSRNIGRDSHIDPMPLPKKTLDDQPLQSLQAVHHLVKQSPLPLPEPLLKQIRTCLLSKSTTAATVSLEKEGEAIALLGSILETAATPSVSYSHRALACDTLSAWLIRSKTYPTLKPPLDEARGTEIWLRICHIVLANFEDASGALSKALKDLLSNTLATVGLGSSRGTEVLRWLATNALQGINVGEGRKGGYYSLDVALRKGVGAEWVFSEYERLGLGAKSGQWKGEQRLVNDLLQNLQDRNVCPAIGKALVSLLASRRTEIVKSGEAETTWLTAWEGPIKEALRQEDLRGRVQIYILPGLFKESSVCFERFVTGLGYAQSTGELSTISEGHTSEEALGALLCCLSVGKDLAFVGEIGKWCRISCLFPAS